MDAAGSRRTRDGRRRVTYRVVHDVWAVHPVTSHDVRFDFARAYGERWAFLNEATPHHVALAVGGAVKVFDYGLWDTEQEVEFTYYERYTMMSGVKAYASAAAEVAVIERGDCKHPHREQQRGSDHGDAACAHPIHADTTEVHRDERQHAEPVHPTRSRDGLRCLGCTAVDPAPKRDGDAATHRAVPGTACAAALRC